VKAVMPEKPPQNNAVSENNVVQHSEQVEEEIDTGSEVGSDV
jgi:hypothetical protein